MQRVVATPPDSVSELCLIRLDLQTRGLSALLYARRLGKAIERSAAEADAADAGLLRSELLLVKIGHFVVLQYWRSYDELEAWSHRPPHSEWWRGAVDRARVKGDFGISHELYAVPRDRIESVAVDCKPSGLFAFGTLAEAVGPRANSRGRLGRQGPMG